MYYSLVHKRVQRNNSYGTYDNHVILVLVPETEAEKKILEKYKNESTCLISPISESAYKYSNDNDYMRDRYEFSDLGFIGKILLSIQKNELDYKFMDGTFSDFKKYSSYVYKRITKPQEPDYIPIDLAFFDSSEVNTNGSISKDYDRLPLLKYSPKNHELKTKISNNQPLLNQVLSDVKLLKLLFNEAVLSSLQPGYDGFLKVMAKENDILTGQSRVLLANNQSIPPVYIQCWKKGQESASAEDNLVQIQLKAATELLKNYANSWTAYLPNGKHHTKTVNIVLQQIKTGEIKSAAHVIDALLLELAKAKHQADPQGKIKEWVNLNGSLVKRMQFISCILYSENSKENEDSYTSAKEQINTRISEVNKSQPDNNSPKISTGNCCII